MVLDAEQVVEAMFVAVAEIRAATPS